MGEIGTKISAINMNDRNKVVKVRGYGAYSPLTLWNISFHYKWQNWRNMLQILRQFSNVFCRTAPLFGKFRIFRIFGCRFSSNNCMYRGAILGKISWNNVNYLTLFLAYLFIFPIFRNLGTIPAYILTVEGIKV